MRGRKAIDVILFARPLLVFFINGASSPTGSVGSSDGSTSQLVQAMAGFGGGSGAADGSNAGVVNAGASEQTFLTTPHA